MAATKGSYGIAEWYGRLFHTLSSPDRSKLLDEQNVMPCRFMADLPALAPRTGLECNKKGGVCSIRNYADGPDGLSFGPITSTCPYRFLEDGLIVREIGKALLGTETPIVIKEIPFLRRTARAKPIDKPPESIKDGVDPGISREDVGKIDMVCVHPDKDPLTWCAVEMQAVYFSGGKIEKDFEVLRQHSGNSIPLPGAKRRPDFRSSGPKRLMPQLQIKVPTLRRWGKKMAVVVDEEFFASLGPIAAEPHPSNADIAWVILRYRDDTIRGLAKMELKEILYCTLERAVEGLTAGTPTTQDEFEKNLKRRMQKR